MKRDSHYEVSIRWSEPDRCFVASIQKLTGCMAHGKSRNGALIALMEVEIEWMKSAKEENWTVPTP
jgi:predicted RNase H-like HicB family nuclease